MQHQNHASETVDAIRARFGQHAIGRLNTITARGTLPSQLPAFDTLTNGLPQGALTEFIGRTSSGVQTLALTILANVQAQGRNVAYVDLGKRLDAAMAVGCGVDLSTLVRICPADSAQAFEIVYFLLNERVLDLLIVECEPLLYEGGEILNAALPQIMRPLNRSQTAVVFLSHPYLSHTSIADYAKLRLFVQRCGWLKRYGDTVGYRIGLHLVKSRNGSGGSEALLDLTFNQLDDPYL